MGGQGSRAFVIAFLVLAAGACAYDGQAAVGDQAVKVCSLVSLAEMKKLAPWPSSVDQHAKAEEVSLPPRSLCVYPTAQIQVEPYRQQIIDTARKRAQLDPVAGIGDEAYIGNNRNLFALVYAKVGPHLLTVEMEIPVGKKFETAKPTAVEIAKAFAAKLR
jgi:hypothetical protein